MNTVVVGHSACKEDRYAVIIFLENAVNNTFVVFIVDIFVVVTLAIIIVVVVDAEDGINFDLTALFLPPLATSFTSTPCFCAMKPSTEKMTNPP